MGRRFQPNNHLFLPAESLSRPLGFYGVLAGMIISTLLVPMRFAGTQLWERCLRQSVH